MRILLVDDDEDIVGFFAEELIDIGHQVELCYSGNKAKEVLNNLLQKNELPHLIFSDTTMSDGDGEELLQYILSIPQLQRIPFFFASGKVGYNSESVKKMGAAGLITKPFDFDEIKKVLENYQGDRE